MSFDNGDRHAGVRQPLGERRTRLTGSNDDGVVLLVHEIYPSSTSSTIAASGSPLLASFMTSDPLPTERDAMTNAQLEQMANTIRQDIIKMLVEAGSGHSAGPLGMADVFTARYILVLKHDPKNPEWPKRDRLILS